MKRVTIILLFLATLTACGYQKATYGEGEPISHEQWDVLLKKHVSTDGRVNYKGFLEDRETLGEYLTLLSDNHPDPEKWTEEEQLAYWINAYNAFTVELILEYYPLESINDIMKLNIPLVNTPWHIDFFKIGAADFDLNRIEHEILREEFDEPRIHFAIVCASYSCPQLRNEAYTAEKVENQLEEQARQFINDPNKNEISEDGVKLSKIFKWFKGDFTKNSTLIEYLNQYSETTISNKAKIKHLDYDWSLNE